MVKIQIYTQNKVCIFLIFYFVVVDPCSEHIWSPGEFAFYDPTCSIPGSLLGCNAGGVDLNCRFCSFGSYVPCPTFTNKTTTNSLTVNSTTPLTHICQLNPLINTQNYTLIEIIDFDNMDISSLLILNSRLSISIINNYIDSNYTITDYSSISMYLK